MQLRNSNLFKNFHCSIHSLLYRTGLLYLVFFSTLVILTPSAQAKEHSIEHKIKAAYLYNFSKFTDWPEEIAFAEQKSFSICILGEDPFGSVITPIENKKAHKLPIKLQYFSQIDTNVDQCKIVFIAETDADDVQSILLALSDTNILTVGESSNFATIGGMIGFVIQNGRVQFQINKQAAKKAQLKFDPRLLKLGLVVRTKQ
ncbi:MAG: YfiR family protein [Methylococcales bacterium]